MLSRGLGQQVVLGVLVFIDMVGEKQMDCTDKVKAEIHAKAEREAGEGVREREKWRDQRVQETDKLEMHKWRDGHTDRQRGARGMGKGKQGGRERER